nr:hypothetical protein [Tanacetum cinerariifolium]
MLVPNSVHEVGESSTATFLQEDGDSLLSGFIRRDINSLFGWIASLSKRVCIRETVHTLVEKKRKAKDKYYGKLIADLGNEVRCSVGERDAVLEDLIKEFGNAEERVECKKLTKELEEARVQAHEFYQEMIRMGVVFEERPNEAINVPVKDEESPSSEPQGSLPAIEQMITLRINDALTADRASTEGAVELRRWFEKTKMVFRISECAEGKKVKNSSRGNYKDNSRHQQNNQKKGNTQGMTTASSEGNVHTRPLLLCNRCFVYHIGPCTIQCHNRGKVGNKSRYCKEKNVTTGANARSIWTCFNCGEQVHIRNHYPKKNKPQGGNTSGRAYMIKDADKKGPNVVTGTFLLNNRYASVLFDSSFDKSFVNTRFSQLVDINRNKQDVSYEFELADGKVDNTNTVLRGCTLNLVNHLFEFDIMLIELGTFDIIIWMDWLSEHDAVIACGKKVVRIPCGNKMLIVEGEKGPSRLKKSKEKRLEDVLVIHDFPEVFPDDLLRLSPPRQVEFRIVLVPKAAPVARARLKNTKKRTKSDQTRQKQEAWRSREKSEAVTVDRGRKTQQNAKRRVENANTVKVYQSFKEERKEEGLKLHFKESSKRRT